MAVTRAGNSGIRTGVLKYDSMLGGNPPVMPAPTATAGTQSASVAFTAISGISTYRVISSPGSITATGSASPISVTGLTAGTAYTFQIRGENTVGNGPYSAASNSVTPTAPKPVVTGGTLTSDATYYYRTFTSNGTLGISNASLTADVLVVAGGGGGGGGVNGGLSRRRGGGGGAGGLRYLSSQTLSVGNTSITIGAGGASTPTNGSNTSFGATTSTGGGAGADARNSIYNGSSGGSGGGSGVAMSDTTNRVTNTGTGGAGTSGQGNAGGNSPAFDTAITDWGGAGGGGAGGVGATSTGNGPAAGGAGATYFGTTYSVGGTGTNNSTSGGSNTGNGGNGTILGGAGGAGGSGIVVVRYTRSQVD